MTRVELIASGLLLVAVVLCIPFGLEVGGDDDYVSGVLGSEDSDFGSSALNADDVCLLNLARGLHVFLRVGCSFDQATNSEKFLQAHSNYREVCGPSAPRFAGEASRSDGARVASCE